MSYPLLSALLSAEPSALHTPLHTAASMSSSNDELHSALPPTRPMPDALHPTRPMPDALPPASSLRQPMPRRPVMVVRPRKFLPPPGQFLATRRLKHNNDVYYQTLYQYNELLKAHERYLDSLLLTTAFQNLKIQTSPLPNANLKIQTSPLSTTHRHPFKFRKILSKTSVLKSYKREFNQPLSVPVVPKYVPSASVTPLLHPETSKHLSTSDNISDLDNNNFDININDIDSDDPDLYIDESRPRIVDFHPDPFPLFHVSPLHTETPQVSSIDDID